MREDEISGPDGVAIGTPIEMATCREHTPNVMPQSFLDELHEHRASLMALIPDGDRGIGLCLGNEDARPTTIAEALDRRIGGGILAVSCVPRHAIGLPRE